ncbi:MAG: NAD(P)/FAD-dependent oxidoreductase, partial [Calditrichia bacterium]|nr:NAD(P)/FAD-dependent oxidoreductase [Calditrichia bacterium]
MFNNNYNVIIIGAGASGLMCALSAGKRGRKVLVLEHTENVGNKIRISGGGKCNFTNLYLEAGNYISGNPHFCKSALNRFNQFDFINLLEKHNIIYQEREFGQLFCTKSSKEIIKMLLDECKKAGVKIQTKCTTQEITKSENGHFSIKT